MSLTKTKIDWADYSTNPVKGLCPMACPYCYARRMYKRYHWDETVRYEMGIWNAVGSTANGSRIFVGSTMELFGPWVREEWLRYIFDAVRGNPDHTFIFLTKQPQNLAKWSPFPPNCWVGVSATSGILADAACAWLSTIEAPVKFLSMEPLLAAWGEGNSIHDGRLGWQKNYHDINWLIIGQQTPISKKTTPKVEWVREIVEAADNAGVPVFLKDNLAGLLQDNWPNQPWAFCNGYYTSEEHPNVDRHLRQSFPVT